MYDERIADAGSAAGVLPGRVAAFEDLDAPDALDLPGTAPDPARAARLTQAQVSAAFKRAGRRKVAERTDASLAALRSPQLGQPPALTAARAATVRSLIAVITTLNVQLAGLRGQAEAHFNQHPDAEIYLSQPGVAAITGARVLGEFGDDPYRYASAKARRDYAGTSPITRASGKRKIVAAQFVHAAPRLTTRRRGRGSRAVEGLVAGLQDGLDRASADVCDQQFASDVLWGSPYEASLSGYESLNAAHRWLMAAGAAPASRYQVVQLMSPLPGVAIAHVRRDDLSASKDKQFSEIAIYVLVQRGGKWWLAAG